MKKILVTGCRGQLGNELRSLEREFPAFSFIFTDKEELDVLDEKNVAEFIADNHIDVTINCAAYTAVDRAEENEGLCAMLNEQAPAYLAQAAKITNSFLIHVSTDYVFDGRSHCPYREQDPANPQCVYGRTKRRGEERLLSVCPDRSVIVRTSWLYSSFGNNFVKTMIRMGREKRDFGVVADQLGTPTYANDLGRALLNMVDKGLQSGIFHFSNEGACSWYDFALEIHRLSDITDKQCKVHPLRTEEYPVAAKRPQFSILDKTKWKNVYRMDIPWWRDSLEKCLFELKQKGF